MTDNRPERIEARRGQPNWTTIGLIAGLVLLLLLVAYFATDRDSDQDKLIGSEAGGFASDEAPPSPDKACSAQSTFELIKRDLFRRAAQQRGSDQAAYDKLASYAVIRMENAVMESQDDATSAVNCSGSMSLDLPPGVAVSGGRHSLMADIDYTVQPGAGGNGTVVTARNVDSVISALVTLTKVSEAAPIDTNQVAPEMPNENVVASPSGSVQPSPASAYPGRPSFNCANARTKGEIAVCSDPGLSSLDLNMATQYQRAVSAGSPDERAILERTRDRFLAYRDGCPNRQCVADAYVGRMREIRDIMEGRWRPRP